MTLSAVARGIAGQLHDLADAIDSNGVAPDLGHALDARLHEVGGEVYVLSRFVERCRAEGPPNGDWPAARPRS
jgi:hypothetical protein